jgi:hypothetical protein
MSQQILIKRSAVTGKVPTTAQLALGELAVNTTDGKLFLKKSVSGVESIIDLGAVTFTGDATGSGTGTVALTLSNTGVAAGSYPKVTVDAKGRVTAGTTLSESDIPALDWSKITTGKPTTLAGYGITDGGSGAGTGFSIFTTTATSKTLANGEHCTITAAGVTLTLPSAPTAGSVVRVTIGGSFTDAIIAQGGGLPIMGLAQNLTINISNITVTLFYVDSTYGWRLV